MVMPFCFVSEVVACDSALSNTSRLAIINASKMMNHFLRCDLILIMVTPLSFNIAVPSRLGSSRRW
jgi:hypothetical protein